MGEISIPGGNVEKFKKIETHEDLLKYLTIALEHEWAVSIEYLYHAYSMPKGKFFYEDPVLKQRNDARGQTIQIGIDEMYHALQLGIVIRQMGGTPSFRSDEVIRYPRIVDNLDRDRQTEDLVTDLYQSAEFKEFAYPKVQNMVLNISYDEVRHSQQFSAMIRTMVAGGNADALIFRPKPENEDREDVRLIHEISRLENDLMHRYLKFVLLFSEHQDLSQRLFKNSINHMRHWDKLSGILVKMSDVVRIENAVRDDKGVERSRAPMPAEYAGRNRLSALETLIPAEEALVARYEKIIGLTPEGEIKDQLKLHLGLTREHVFTQDWLLKNARRIRGLE
jgi:bacterioferritin (cytochrome b1)